MPDSDFTNAFNQGNTAFAQSCAEQFHIITGAVQTPCMANSIDDLTTEQTTGPGGLNNNASVILFIDKAIFCTAGIRDGAKLLVRGKRVRVSNIADEGDNQFTVTCGPTGVQM